MSSKKRYFRAFSLIEVSVVILIIGIFIAGVFVADGMITKFRLTAAKNLSLSSPVIALPSSALWLETSLDSSFNPSEAKDDAPLSTWYDQRNTSNKVAITTAGSSPTYSNTINRVHAVEFDGTANKHFTFDGSFLNNTDYTIFILEKRKDPKGDNYFLGEAGAGLNNSLALGYSANNQIIHAQGTNSYPSGISTYSDSKDKPRVFAFSHSASSGNQTYINGVLAAENTDVAAQAHLTGVGTLAIGKNYIGEIGEIIVLTKALNTTDRTSIEDYLGKKWTSSINRNKAPNCIGGLVTINGCDNSAPITCSATGTGYNQTGLAYTSGSSFSCDSGFNGTINYSCLASGPASNITGSCTAATCTAAATAEYSAKTGLAYSTGSGTFNCDAPYVGTKNYTCTTTGEATGITGTCTQPNCSILASSGFVAKASLPYAATPTAIPSPCQTDHYFITPPTYTCTTSGLVTPTGSCLPITCNTPAGTGYLAQTNLPYAASGSGTFSCNTAGGFIGTVNYTCTTAGVATGITSTCALPGPCTVSSATNGTHTLDTSTVSGSTIHIFTTTAAAGSNLQATFNFTCPSARNVQVLVVAGGGGGTGGGFSAGGSGGGAGGLIYNASFAVSTLPIEVKVGTGGLGGPSSGSSTSSITGSNGQNSVFSSLTSVGGGGGGAREANSNPAPSGGSGGGGGISGNSKAGGSGTSGQGNAGGNNFTSLSSKYGGGGGGGAGSVGGNGTFTAGGAGGVGVRNTISVASGLGPYYAGGGGASYYGSGGSNGAGTPTTGGGGNVGSAGAANTGGGGGGAASQDLAGGNGGSGIVIVRYTN